MLARHPSIFVAPLLGAVVALVLSQVGAYLTNPLGGVGASLFDWIASVIYTFAFAVAIIQADEIERGLRGTFDSAWEEARRKAAGIFVAAIGFWFLIYIAQYVGAMFGEAIFYFLQVVAAFFLIYTIPAAAIGGLPGSLAIAGSLRAVRADPLGAAILAIAFVGLFVYAAPLAAAYLAVTFSLDHIVAVLVLVFLEALVLTYLAFPFAKQYAGIAFRA